MDSTLNSPNQIKVEVIIRDDCFFSRTTLESLQAIMVKHPNLNLQVTDIAESSIERRIVGGITPSIWVNDQLWFLGSFSAEKFDSRLNSMLENDSRHMIPD